MLSYLRKYLYIDFEITWEQRKLGELSNLLNNLRIPITSSDRIKGSTPYYGANGIQDYVSGETHKGDFVLLAEDGANDIYDYPIINVKGSIWVNNHAHVLEGRRGKLYNLFLVYRIKSINISSYLVGGSRSKLNSSILKKITFMVPIFKEQILIGNLLNQIDTTITLHQRNLFFPVKIFNISHIL
ncbi:restriction endonuclease subunit S [Globicatella sp. HMSC072A10]|nr:restriction endonuclease subunit S [Globicatella sp. HMSC072A10]